jgi:hypothetical protein
MIGKLALFILVAMATTTIAFADPINGTQRRISRALLQIAPPCALDREGNRAFPITGIWAPG